ncbi:MAG: DUF11 domain-containing protein [Lewinellaceae bacterium]|nr:DUF11 domain-containing protein [Lewinellaceae bacterium]
MERNNNNLHKRPIAARMLPVIGAFLLTLWLPSLSYAVTYISTTNGNWGSGATWVGGVAPGFTVGVNDSVVVKHVVTYNLMNDLEVNGVVNIVNGTFRTALSGDGMNRSVFVRSTGRWRMCNGKFYLPIFSCGYGCGSGSNLSGNFVNENGDIYIYNSTVEIAQNWEDVSSSGGGSRSFIGGCLKIGENFSNKGSFDLYDATCIELGLHGSGNWSNEYRVTFQNSCTLKLTGSGSLENNTSAPNGVFGGAGSPDIAALKVSNGNVTNNGPWGAQILNFCIDGGSVGGSQATDFNNDVTNNDTPAACTAVNNTNCNSCPAGACMLALTGSVSTPVTCVNGAPGNNGAVTVTITPGSATESCGPGSGITYSWNTAPVQTTQTATNLNSGTYTVTVTDAAGCTATASATLTTPVCCPTVSSVTTSPVSSGCVGSTFSATINHGANPGNLALYYSTNAGLTATQLYDFANHGANNIQVLNASVTPAPAATSTVVSSLSIPSIGSYTIYAILANGNPSIGPSCKPMQSVSFTVNPTPVLYSVTGGGTFCAGGAGVPVGLSDSDFGVNYQLKRDGNNAGAPVAGTGSAISFGNQTVAGAYTVVATIVATGCTATMSGSVNITINPSPSISFTTTTPACAASDGAISLTVTGGTMPYTYDWADLPGSNDPEDRTGLAPGIYAVTVTGNNGCTDSEIIVLNPANGCPPIEICGDVDDDVFYIAPIPGATNYTWTVPLGATIVSGQGTSSITVDWTTASYGTGNICVTPETSCSVGDPFCVPVEVINCNPIADLSLNKTSNLATPNVGDVITFTITVSNGGPDAATGVAVEDIVPAGYSNIINISNSGMLSGNTISWSGLSIAANGSIMLTFQATVDAPTGAPNEYKNVAEVTDSDQGDPDSTPDNLVGNTPAEDDEDSDTPVPQVVDLSLNKTVSPTSANVGSTVTFTITLTNLSATAATGVAVEDYAPGGFSNITAISDGGSVSMGTVSWSGLTVPAFGTKSVTFQATVDAPTGAPGEYTNVTQVTDADQYDTDSSPDNMVNNTPGEDDEDDVTLALIIANLSLNKTVDNASPNVGSNVVFTITVSNAGPNAATGVTVEDLLPAGLTYVSDNSGGNYNSGTGIWTVGSIANGGSASIQITATVTTAGAKTNYAQVADSDQFDPNSTPGDDSNNQDDDDTETVTPQVADLSLTKTVNNASPNVGSNVVFTITVSNAGPNAATGVTVEDLLPAGLTYVSDNSGGNYNSGTGIWTVGTVANGGSASIQITATVTTSGAKTNYAQVADSDQFDPNSTPGDDSNNQDDDDDETLTPQVADLSLTKTVNNASPNVGSNVVFTITVSNAGPNAATSVTVEDLLPAGLTYVSDNSGGNYNSGTGIWTVGTVANGGSASIQITATVTTAGAKTNYAQVEDSDQFDPNSTPGDDSNNQDDDDDETLTPQVADLSLTKTVNNASPNVGSDVTYTITVSNAGPNAATNVSVEDLLPAGMSYVTSSPSQGSYNNISGLWTIGTVANGGSATLTITATVTSPGAKTNYAQVNTSDQFDPNSVPGDDSITDDDDDDETLTPQVADLSLTKTVNNASPNVGSNVIFTITVSNAGPNAATGVTVQDLLPAGLTYVSDNSGGNYNSGTGIWTVGTVANGGSASIQITATVTTAGAKTNYAQVQTVDQFDPNSVPGDDSNNQDDDDDETVTPQVADLSLTKTVNNASPNVGSNVVFTITVSNAGPNAATGVTVEDLLPAGLTYVSDNSGGNYNSGTGIWTVGTVANGGSASIQITATVTTAGAKTNYAQVADSDQFDPNSTPGDDSNNQDDDDDETVTPQVADLSLTKTVNNASPNVGSNVVFTITVSNAGPNAATSVTVEDLLPAGLTYVSDNSGGNYNSGTGIWTVGTVANGGSTSIQITATVTTAGAKTNYAQVQTVDQFDPNSTPGDDSNNQDDDDDETLTPQVADLSLTKTVNNPSPQVGGQVIFTITVSNAGPNAATGVTVEDLLPAGLTYVSDNSGGNYNSGTGIWTVGTVANGGSASIQITATVTTAGAKTNYAQVADSDQFDPNSTPGDDSNNQDDDDDETVTPQVADLSLTKTVNNASPNVGSNVIFTITVSNAGPNAATGVTVEDLLPAGLTYVSDNSGGNYNSGTGIWTVGTVANGGSASIQITATVTTAGAKTNYAQIADSDQFDPNSTPGDDSNNQDDDDDETLTPQVADLSLTKTVNNPSPQVGGQVIFTITVSNAGPNAATGVTVEDLLPAGLTYVSDNSGGNYNNGTGIWTVGTVANGGSASIQITATVTTAGAKTNYAQIADSDQFDPNSTPGDDSNNQDDDDDETVTPQVADLSLTKTANNSTPNVGSNVIFTITVSNAGPNAATGVTVEDLLPAGLTYVSDNSGGNYNSGTGIWTVGTVANGGSASIQITATVTTAGAKTNYAQVQTVDQFDPNSTPGDDSNNQDDDDTETVTPPSANLLLSKSVNNTTPNVGTVVTFTIQVSNLGPNGATGVSVEDYIPNGYGSIAAISNGGTLLGNTTTWSGLSISAFTSLNLTFQATVLAPGVGVSFRNTAQVTDSDEFDPTSTPNNMVNNTPAEDDEDDANLTPRQADISLSKSVSPTSANVGDVVTFTLTLSNAGPNSATAVSVQDYVPAGFSNIAAISGGGTQSMGTITWAGLTVPVGANTVTLTFQATVDAPTGDPAEYKNTAQVTASAVYDPDSQPNNLVNNTPAQDDEDDAELTLIAADLSLVKTVSNATPNVGDVVTFTLSLSNAGPNAATGVAVADYVPNGYGSISGISNGGSFSMGTISWSGLSVPVGANTLTLTFQATVLAPGGGVSYVNTAEVTDSDQYDPNSTPNNLVNNTPAENDEDSESVTPQQSDLSVVKTASNNTANVGSVVTFTINLSNAGPNAATGVAVQDYVPNGYGSITNISNGGSAMGNTITWSGLGVPVGANTLSLTFQATVLAPGPGVSYRNTTQVTDSDQHDPDSQPNNMVNNTPAQDDEDDVIVTPPQADLELVKFANNSTPNVGQATTFTILVSNNVSAANPATGIVVHDVLPSGLVYVPGSIAFNAGATGATITANGAGAPTLVWTINQLDPGEVVTLTLQATVLEPTNTPNEFLNIAQVVALNEYDTDSQPNDGMGDDFDDDLIVPKQIDVSVTNTVSNTSPNVGQTVTFTVTLNNAGPDIATNIVVRDLIPAGYTYVPMSIASNPNMTGATITNQEVNPSTLQWTVNQLDPGETVILTFQAVVNAPVNTPGYYLNEAEVTAHIEDDVDSYPNDGMGDDYATAAVTPKRVDLQLVKTVDISNPSVGQNVTFAMLLSNNANGGMITDTATGVVVQDLIPGGFSYIIGSIGFNTLGSGATVVPNAAGNPNMKWSVNNLAPGKTVVLSFQAVVDAPTGSPGEYVNAAQVTAQNQYDLDSSPNDGAGDDYDTEAVTPVNDPPVANRDDYVANEDVPLVVTPIGVLVNDSDPNGDPITITFPVTNLPDNGTLVLNPNGSFTYTPNPNFNGQDTFIYEICDPYLACDTALVVITVNSVDDLPIANRDDFTLNEDAPTTPLAVLPNDDFGGDGPCVNCTITVTDPANNGTSVVNNNGTPNDPTDDFIDYTPAPNFNGNDTLIYQICDFDGDCDTALVVITVNSVDDLPVANRDDVTVNEDAPTTPLAVLPNDDFGGDGPCVNCTITVTDPANNGTSVVNNNGTPLDPTDDFIDYTPAPNFNGNDTLVYQICDFDGDCDTALVVITVNSVDDLPIANRDDVTVNEDAPTTPLAVLPNDDFGGDGPCVNCTITVTDPANNGTSVVNNNGTPLDPTDDFIDYTPNANFSGNDTLIYQICDLNGDCDTALVVITVNNTLAQGGPPPPHHTDTPNPTPTTTRVRAKRHQPDTGEHTGRRRCTDQRLRSAGRQPDGDQRAGRHGRRRFCGR